MSYSRDDIEALLPFYANGTLEGADRAAVEAALETDAELRADLAALQAIRQTMQAEEVASPGDFGLARLMRDVEAETPVTAPPAAANDNVVPVTRLRLWQTAAAVILAVGLGVNLLPGPGDAPETGRSIATNEAPTTEEGFSLASGGAPDFTIAFAPDAREAEIRALLLQAGVEITQGPSALGLYGLSLLDSVSDETARPILANSGIVDDLQ
ncbi:hypothetical protein [Alterinioella nitratireducens]|uniref:hypothetical protein n=1 Tax=Alterinioella nitratireducens TaxID=2735915 RepID=UPI00405A3D9A